MVKSTTSIIRLPKSLLSYGKELGTISTVMVQQLPVPFKLMGKTLSDTKHGRQVKGAFAPDGHYYDENSGELVNQTRTIKGVTYHFDENAGNATKV